MDADAWTGLVDACTRWAGFGEVAGSAVTRKEKHGVERKGRRKALGLRHGSSQRLP